MSKMENYILVSEFAKTIGISVQAVHKAMKEKRISDYKRIGNFYLIHRSEIQAFKANR